MKKLSANEEKKETEKEKAIFRSLQEDTRTHHKAALPNLSFPSVYHKPQQDPPAQGSCRLPAKDLPPGVAALVAGATSAPALAASLVPKRIEVGKP
eukprot:scaffold670564_cov80-Prasinocladus_malaysianus.AAC.2